MGLTKQYLRYSPVGNFNIIASVKCNVAFVVINHEAGRYLAVGACEDIAVWDLRLSEKVGTHPFIDNISIYFAPVLKEFKFFALGKKVCRQS